MDRETALAHILSTCGEGWLTLVEIIYNNKPSEVKIQMVFQKWGGLKVEYVGENELYEELLDCIYEISQKMCEVCGKSAGITVIDGWETTLCKAHFDTNDSLQKYRSE